MPCWKAGAGRVADPPRAFERWRRNCARSGSLRTGAPAARDLLLQPDHAKIPLSLMVVEQHPHVVQVPQQLDPMAVQPDGRLYEDLVEDATGVLDRRGGVERGDERRLGLPALAGERGRCQRVQRQLQDLRGRKGRRPMQDRGPVDRDALPVRLWRHLRILQPGADRGGDGR
jgi:hypothetical protein